MYAALGYPQAWGVTDGERVVARIVREGGRARLTDIPAAVVGDREFWSALARAEQERVTVPAGGNDEGR